MYFYCCILFLFFSCSASSCARNCSNHGECVVGGLCRCDDGYTGDACELNACPNNCSGFDCVRGDVSNRDKFSRFTSPLPAVDL